MSRFTVNLNEPQKKEKSENTVPNSPSFGHYQEPKRRGLFAKVLFVLFGLLTAFLVIGGVVFFFYWQSVKKTPAYSLALIVDAARHDDKAELDKLIDTEAVANNFIPQISEKAVELYGRNLPPQKIAKVAQIAAPLMPAIKDRAREELPRLIKEKTKPIERIPYWMIALGAERAVEIKQDGDTAQIKSKLPERPLELTMKRDGNIWKVTAVKDEILAKNIAQKIGQEIIALASKGSLEDASRQLGTEDLTDLIKQLEGIFNK